MSLGIKKESIDDIRSSNDNLNQNLTEININEEKIIENNVEVTLTVKVNISKDNKDNSSTNVDKDTLKDVNEIDKGKSSLVNEDEEDKLNNTNEIDKPKQRILVCVGVPGSGKSTFSKKLCQVDHVSFTLILIRHERKKNIYI
jgi:signal recognition particle GTPase